VVKLEKGAAAKAEFDLALIPGKTYKIQVLARSEKVIPLDEETKKKYMTLLGENSLDEKTISRIEESRNNYMIVYGGNSLAEPNKIVGLNIKDLGNTEWRWYEFDHTVSEDIKNNKSTIALIARHSDMWVEAICIRDTDPGPHPATLTLNPGVTHQTMDGFGFFGSRNVWWSGRDPNTYYNDQWIKWVLEDLGLTMWRNNVEPTYPEPHSERGIPGTDNNWGVTQHAVKALSDRAKELGVPLRIILSIWSPPGQWKDPKSTKNGSKLLPEHYEDYGKWLVAAIDMYKAIGADVYALSFQNEPAFAVFYDSTVYTADEYVAMFNAVAPIVKASYPDVLLFGAEHMLLSEIVGHASSKFHEALLKNPDSMKLLDRFAVHGYSMDGVNSSELAAGQELWASHKRLIEGTGKTTWMSETSGYSAGWVPPYGGGRLAAATALQSALLHGDLSAWVWWQGCADQGGDALSQDGFINAAGPTKSFYAHKQFYRFIRPGAVRIDSAVSGTETDTDLLVTAYTHAELGNTVITFVNASKNAYTVDISGIAGLEYEFFITSNTEDCESKGNVVNNVVIPAESVVTLVNGNYTEKK